MCTYARAHACNMHDIIKKVENSNLFRISLEYNKTLGSIRLEEELCYHCRVLLEKGKKACFNSFAFDEHWLGF